jgi:tetratricopeptide (TPR) repeat protein
MEGMMHELVGSPADTPLAQAQQLLYQAFGEEDETRRLELARRALKLCADCADAYVLLAEHASRRSEALALYQQGVAAGQRALGEQPFRAMTGRFWGVLQTRPYMRARLGLAQALWTAGRRDQAIEHAREMLRLNPGDNQGVRYTLAGWLLSQDRDADVVGLLDSYPEEGSAAWAYTRALLAFRHKGDTPEARALLQEAIERNQHVPAYLAGQKSPPHEQPDYYIRGEESEALEYIGSFLAGWKATLGAIPWVRQVIGKKRDVPEGRGPLSVIKSWLQRHLRQEDDSWQAESRPLPGWLTSGAEKVRPWVTLVLSETTDLVLAHDIQEAPPSARHVWDALVEAMQHPAAGEPHRPTELQVRAGEHWEFLKPHLEEVGIRLTVAHELVPLDRVLPEMAEHVVGKPRPGLLDMPGVTPEQAARFYNAAALYYQEAPWRKVGYESAIRLECDRVRSGPWYAVVMGQSALTMGLALYEELETLTRMWTEPSDDEENALKTVSLTVIYGEESELVIADLDAARLHGWRVARPDAYPAVFRKELGRSMRPPLSWELELLEAALRAIPGFVNRRAQDDPTPEEMTVPVASGELRLTLAWVPEAG